MIDEQLTTLVHSTYRQSDMAYRIGLLKEFFEFVFFVQHEESPTTESINQFIHSHRLPDSDSGFLQQQSAKFLESFSKDTFNYELDQLAIKTKHLPTLQLAVPVIFSREDVEILGQWVRKNIRKDMLLEFSIDPGIVAGCQIAWQDKLHDFSIEYFFARYGESLRQTLIPLVSGKRAEAM